MQYKPGSFSDYLYRQIYVISAITAIIIVFAGFAKTYFLKVIFTPTMERTLLVHIHGVVMTLWFSLFVLQSFLIRKGNVVLHRRIGIFGAVVATAIIIIGPITAITAFRPSGTPQFMSVALFGIVEFAIFVIPGLLMRQRKDFHKRFMVLASLSMLTAAIARIPLDFIQQGSVPLAFALQDLLILAIAVFDTIKNRRLHPVYGWGLPALIALQVSSVLIVENQQWVSVANWLVH